MPVQGVACTRNTFITSSPRWLITFTAILPVAGLAKGRDVSLFRLSQASSSISAGAERRCRRDRVLPGR